MAVVHWKTAHGQGAEPKDPAKFGKRSVQVRIGKAPRSAYPNWTYVWTSWGPRWKRPLSPRKPPPEYDSTCWMCHRPKMVDDECGNACPP